MAKKFRTAIRWLRSDNPKAAPQTKSGPADKNPKWVGLVAIAVAFALCGPVAQAQQQAKVFKIGWLTNETKGGPTEEFVLKALLARGYVEGKNIAIEFRSTEGKLERLPALADELVRLKVDVLVAVGTAVALATKDVTKTIPIVFTSGGDPVAVGLIDSLAHPGGNLTGLSTISAELAGKKLELLKETVPKLSRVAVLWNPKAASSTQEWKESLHPARELGLQLHSMEVSSADKLESAFKDAIKARSAALAVTSGPINNSNEKRIADLAAKHRLPAIYPRKEFVVSGGLMSYGPDEAERYRRLAYLIDRVLKGTKPAELPVERPMGFEFHMNLKTAKALNLTIPPIVLMRVTSVVK
jgi:putative ABC transport system substrate-binding protein